MEDDTFKRILQDKQFHLQIKAEQKEIIQMCWKEKDSMAKCYQRAWDRPKKGHKTRWWGLHFMALGHLCAD